MHCFKTEQCGVDIWPSPARARFWCRRRVGKLLPAYLLTMLAVGWGIDHKLPAGSTLQLNHDSQMMYCDKSLPLNFMLFSNVVGFGGCGVVSSGIC